MYSPFTKFYSYILKQKLQIILKFTYANISIKNIILFNE
jgi:hypothetical protein